MTFAVTTNAILVKHLAMSNFGMTFMSVDRLKQTNDTNKYNKFNTKHALHTKPHDTKRKTKSARAAARLKLILAATKSEGILYHRKMRLCPSMGQDEGKHQPPQ